MDRQFKIHSARATRPLEFVGFFTLKILTEGEALFIFLALDAYSGYLFNLGWEMDQQDKTILKKIYFLLEDPVFLEYNTKGFSLVMEEHDHLAEPIAAIVRFSNGNVMFDRSYNSFLFLPVYESIDRYLKSRNKRLI
jgi:hypothetical protein